MEENMGLEASEYKFVDEYLRNSNTSVLTIMFTDIVGYTEYTEKNGDAKANDVRKTHDKIMQEAIEGQSQGKIIKFIGDAVMAIFSEPSSAVEASVELQRKFHNLYETGNFPLKIRMGLHLGQVTIERKIGHDIFGRHVNKAARVESKASGGQIFATYPVVETLKGHVDIDGVQYHNHGKVSAKGITEEFEVYEVLYLRSQKPSAPLGLRQKLFSPKFLSLLLFGLVLLLAGFYHVSHPTLYFYSAPKLPLVLNHKKVLNLKTLPNQEYKQIHEKIPVGSHFLYYQVSSVVRYYTPLNITFSSDFIKPQYKYFSLPSEKVDVLLKGGEKAASNFEKELKFKEVVKNFRIKNRHIKVKSVQSIEKVESGVKAQIQYKLISDSGLELSGSFEKVLNTKTETSFSDYINIGSEGEFEYSMSVRIWKDALRIYHRVDYIDIERP